MNPRIVRVTRFCNKCGFHGKSGETHLRPRDGEYCNYAASMTDNTPDAPAVALLPCPTPWCWRGRSHVSPPTLYEGGSEEHKVLCQDCGVETPYYRTKAEAIALWNLRPTAALPSEDDVERVARALLLSESGGEMSWENLDLITRGAFKRDARAAIAAMAPEQGERTTLPADVHEFVSRTGLLATNHGGWFDKHGFDAINPLCDAANAILGKYDSSTEQEPQ